MGVGLEGAGGVEEEGGCCVAHFSNRALAFCISRCAQFHWLRRMWMRASVTVCMLHNGLAPNKEPTDISLESALWLGQRLGASILTGVLYIKCFASNKMESLCSTSVGRSMRDWLVSRSEFTSNFELSLVSLRQYLCLDNEGCHGTVRNTLVCYSRVMNVV